MFETKSLPTEPDVVAPDGSDVRVLLAVARGSMAHFTLPPGAVSAAVEHRTVEELWYVLGGAGEMWRRYGGDQSVVPLATGVSVSIPVGTGFQFRSTGDEPLTIVGVTMPPWPGEQEAFAVAGPWEPNAGTGE